MKAEGFTEVQYVKTPLNEGPTKALAEGKIDITQNDTAGHLMELDIGAPVVMVRPLAGAPDDSENECYESD